MHSRRIESGRVAGGRSARPRRPSVAGLGVTGNTDRASGAKPCFRCCSHVCAILGDDAKPAAAEPADRVAYEAAEKKLGNDANSHVKLALWCEAHGLTAERIKHLALAVASTRRIALARGFRGWFRIKGNGSQPEDVGEQIKNDPAYHAAIREYLARRARTASKADAQLKLAAWCAKRDSKSRRSPITTEVTRLDPTARISLETPGLQETRQSLGQARGSGRAQKQEAERQKHADQHWKTRLEKLREGLESTPRDATR